MTNLLIAALALMPVSNDGWELKVPFKEKMTQEHELLILIDMGGQEMDVEVISLLEIESKTDKGFKGSYGFTEIYMQGEAQDAGTWPAEFNSNGVLMYLEGDDGPGMRRMMLPFFMAYPNKSVEVGDTWKYEDSEDEAVDGHRAIIEYKVAVEGKVSGKDALKIEFKLKEEGGSPMTGEGHFWIDQEGNILKFKMNLESWPVPMAQQTFDAEITGEIID